MKAHKGTDQSHNVIALQKEGRVATLMECPDCGVSLTIPDRLPEPVWKNVILLDLSPI